MIGKTIKYNKEGYSHSEFEGVVVDKVRGAWSSHTVVSVTKYIVHRLDGAIDVILPTWIKEIK